MDLGLQTHKAKCRVHEEFKYVLAASRLLKRVSQMMFVYTSVYVWNLVYSLLKPFHKCDYLFQTDSNSGEGQCI